jgi:spermidine synthase
MTERTRIVPFLLLGSGFCALVYQTAWLREFRLIFGASTAASAAVVALFIAGLGLGGLLLGPRADRQARPLLFYAWLEAGIALSAALTPPLLELVQAAYAALGGTPSLGLTGGTLLRLALAALVLAVPTWLMGGTLPAAVRAVTRRDDAGRRAAALLYGVNTLGAVAGAFLSTFFLLELFGTRRTLWLACLLNLLVAVVARRVALELPEADDASSDAAPAAPVAPAAAPAGNAPPAFVLAAAAVVGFAFFLMELVWYRMLGPLLGGSIFTFGLILSMALLGVGLGGAAYARLRQNRPATLAGFAYTCLGEAACVALPFALGDRLAVLALLLRPLGGVAQFWGHVLGWSIVCGVVVLPAAFVAGYQFPMLIALLGQGRRDVGRQVGLTYAFNTAGAIAGSLAGGFGLIPLLSAPGAWRATGALLLALGGVALLLAWRRGARAVLTLPAGLGVAAALLLLASGPSAAWRHSGIGVGRAPTGFASPNALEEWLRFQRRIVAWERDGVESSVALETIGPGYAFVVNGKVDGNARGDAATMIMSGLVGALLHPAPERSLVIGLGTGGTAGWLADVPGMQRTDVIELEPVVLDVARDCAPINRAVLSNPKVRVTLGDAREVLLVSRERYDVIFSEPSNPYRAGIASLFTREYYQAAAQRLNARGLFLQWVQAYDVDAPTIRTVYATLGSVFPAVETWQVGPRDLLLVASSQPLVHDVARLRARLGREPYRSGVRYAWRVADLEGFLAAFVAGPELARALAETEQTPLNTDDRNVVEFGFARTVGRPGLFTVVDLRDAAFARGLHHPRTTNGDVDWSRVDDDRVMFHPSPAQAPRIHAGFSLAQSLLAALWLRAGSGDSAGTLALWRALDREPRNPLELTLLASLLADLGDPAAQGYVDALRAQVPLEGEAVGALLLVRQGRHAEALESLERLFAAYRRDPWPHPPLVEAALGASLDLASVRPDLAPRLLAAVREPFVLRAVDASRLRLVGDLLARLPPGPECRETLHALEPRVPWNREWLELRLRCYSTLHDPRAAEARADLRAFLALERLPLLLDEAAPTAGPAATPHSQGSPDAGP